MHHWEVSYEGLNPTLSAILLGLGLSVGASGAFATTVPNLVEVPYLKPAVKAGKIPPIEERVPEDVDVFDMKAWGKNAR